MSIQEFQFKYFNEFGEQVNASFTVDKPQEFLRGFTRGVTWDFDDNVISICKDKKVANVCLLPTRELVLVLFHQPSYLSRDNECYLYYTNGLIYKQILCPGFDLNLEPGSLTRCGNCIKLELTNGATPFIKVVCLMTRPLGNGYNTEFASYYFNEHKLAFDDASEVWQES